MANRQDLVQLECNIDDMNPQFYPVVLEKLLSSGALDAWLTPIIMKFGRPGILLTALLAPCDLEKIKTLVFSETSTIGVRIFSCSREELAREFAKIETTYGPIEIKVARNSQGLVKNVAPEFRSCLQASLNSGVPLKQVFAEAVAQASKFYSSVV